MEAFGPLEANRAADEIGPVPLGDPLRPRRLLGGLACRGQLSTRSIPVRPPQVAVTVLIGFDALLHAAIGVPPRQNPLKQAKATVWFM